jgi:signal transduction histidine kinase
MLKMFQKEVFCPLPEEMHQAIAAMIRSNRNLIHIMDALLEVHCYEAGMKTFNFIPCDLWAISHEVVQEIQPLAEQKGIALTLACDDTSSHSNTFAKVQGDHLELRRMITNLLGNSIKFTETGSVELRLKPTTQAGQGNSELPQDWLILEVQDTGFGMTDEEQETLFERFHKGTHKQSSSGLGLHLVQRIVQIHQGSIEVESELGKGSLFTVRLPVESQSK